MVERMRLATPDTPVIGCAVPPLAQRGLNAGAVDYLIKPVTRADLQRAIQAVGRPVRRVLLVDDEPDLTRVLTYMLRSIDDAMEMVTAADGAQALLQLHNARYDLVLLDIMLPEMSGWQVLERMRLDETLCDVPCIIISACDPTDQPRASQALVAAMGQGLSLGKLLRCSLELSRLLLQPD